MPSESIQYVPLPVEPEYWYPESGLRYLLQFGEVLPSDHFRPKASSPVIPTTDATVTTGALTVPAIEPSTMDHVFPRLGSRMSQDTAPDADSAAEGEGKFPATTAFFV